MNELMGLIIILVAGVLLFALVSRGSVGKKRSGIGRVDRELVASRWQAVESMSRKGESGLRSAVSEADKLVDYVLKNRGYAGQTMAARLKRAERGLSDKQSVWRAHKLRNAYAHDVNIDVVQSHAREAIGDFKVALKDLGAL